MRTRGARLVFWQMIMAALLLLITTAGRAQIIPDLYDDAFRDATELWLPGRDWRELKAQCYQESLLRPAALSPAGARGLCQFMPATWAEVARRLPGRLGAEPPEHPIASIHAAGAYMRQLRRSWTASRPDWERQRLAWGSYNTGLGNMLKAQRACKVTPECPPSLCRDWPEIAAALPSVTGRHALETQTYVVRIERWLIALRSG